MSHPNIICNETSFKASVFSVAEDFYAISISRSPNDRCPDMKTTFTRNAEQTFLNLMEKANAALYKDNGLSFERS